MGLKAEATRFRQPKLSSEEGEVSTNYKNKWAVNIFSEWQESKREKEREKYRCNGGLFKDYDLHKDQNP